MGEWEIGLGVVVSFDKKKIWLSCSERLVRAWGKLSVNQLALLSSPLLSSLQEEMVKSS